MIVSKYNLDILNDLKDQARKDQMTELNLQLADLRAQLDDADDDRRTWEYYQAREDSMRLAFLEEERETNFQNTQEKVEDYTEKLLAEKDARIEDHRNGTVPTVPQDEEEGMNGAVLLLIGGAIFLLALGAIAFLMILINKKSVVYLKPKTSDDNSNNSSEKNEKNESAETPKSSENNATTQSAHPEGSSANKDESVISSELKDLRQSSIVMSASQKEGATQIIKDWMDDGSPQDTNSETEGEE